METLYLEYVANVLSYENTTLIRQCININTNSC